MSFDPKIILSAEDRTAAAFASVTRGLEKVGLSASTLSGGLAGLGASVSVGAFAALIKSTINAVDALGDVADATGSTVDNISALEDVALRTGANIDIVSSTLIRFNAVLREADPAKGPGAVLKALGLEVEALRRQDPAEALRQVAVALAGFSDDGNKARAVQELFGKSVKEAAAFLKDLAESGQLNAKVTAAQQAEAEKFNKELFRLQKNADDVARVIVGSLVPSVNDLIERYREGAQAGKGFFAVASEQYWQQVRSFYEAIGLAKDPIVRVRGELENISRVMQSDVLNSKQLAALEERRVALNQKLATLQNQASPAGGGRGFINPELPRPQLDIPGAGPAGSGGAAARARASSAPDPTAAARRYLESLQGQLQSAQALSAAEKLLDDIRRGSLGRVTPELEKQLKTTAAQVDATRALTEAEKERAQSQKALDDLFSNIAQRDADRLAALLGAGETGRLQKQRDDVMFLAEAYEQGRLGAVGSAEAMRLFSESAQAYLGTGGTVPEAFEEMGSAALRAADRIQDALGEELTRLLSGEFEDIGDGFSQLIKRMLAEATAAQVMQTLFPKGGGFDPASILSSLVSFDGGGYTGNGPRSGGLDGKGGYMAMLHPRETVVDHTKGGGIAAPNIYIYNTIGSVASQADVVAGMQQTRVQILGELQRGARYGGAGT